MPNAFQLFGTISVNTQQFESSLKRADAALKNTAASMSKTDAAASRVGNSTRRAATNISAMSASSSRLGGAMGVMSSGFAAVGLSATAIAYGVGRSAVEVDNLKNVLRAATGSADGATKKLAELKEVAARTPGALVTTAASTYALLKPMGIAEGVINDLIQSFGRIKLALPNADINQFAFNVNQLFANFDKQDFKQAVENFPRFGEIIKKSFDLKSARDDMEGLIDELRKLKEAGKLTRDSWLKGLADGVNTDQSLGQLQDTLGTKFEKLTEQLKMRVAPLGASILDTFLAGFSPSEDSTGGFGDFWYKLGEETATGATMLGEQIDKAYIELGIKLREGLDVMNDPAAAAKARSNSKEYWDGVYNEIEVQAQGVKVQRLQDQRAYWVGVLADPIADPKIVSEAQKNLADVNQKLTVAMKKYEELPRTAAESIEKTTPAVVTAVEKLGNPFERSSARAKELGTAAGGSFGMAVADSVTSKSGQVTTATNGLMSAVTLTTTGPAMASGNSLGKDIARGMADGIAAGHNWVVAAAIALANAATGAARGPQGVDSHSPSRVFFAIGQDVGQGFIDGIESMKTGVHAAMVKMLDISKLKIKFGKGDTEGVSLLTSLIKELDELTPRTRLEAVMAELTAKKYAKLKKEIKDVIILTATRLTQLDQLANRDKIFERLAEQQGGGGGTNRPTGGNGEFFIDGTGSFETSQSDIGALNLMDEGTPPRLLAAWEKFWVTMDQRLQNFKASLPSFKTALGENLIGAIYSIGDVFANAVAQWDGTAKGFFKSLAQGFRQMVSQIVSELVRLMVVKAIMSVIGGIAGGASGYSPSSSAGILGGGMTGMGLASGGFVSGPGSSTSDSIPARLSNGEFVMSAKAVRKWGSGFFEGLNSMSPAMAFAGGGMVGGATYNNSSSPSFNINISGSSNPGQTAAMVKKEVMAAMRREEIRNK